MTAVAVVGATAALTCDEPLAQRARRTVMHIHDALVTHAVELDLDCPDRLALVVGELLEELRAALADPSLHQDPLAAAELCELLLEATEVQQDLRERGTRLRFLALGRIHAALARLRAIGTVTELLAETPAELCHCCDFDRAFVSRVDGSSWVPAAFCLAVGQDTGVTIATEQYLTGARIPLSPMLLETEIARRHTPALVTDPQTSPRTHKPLMATWQSTGYVVTELEV